VIPRGFSRCAISRVRSFSKLKVSSSKKNSFTARRFSFAQVISPMTSSTDRLLYRCPLVVCGQRQNVHWAGHPRVV
jgi:hypothetical protein